MGGSWSWSGLLDFVFDFFFLLMGFVVDRGWVHGGRSVVDGS